MTERAARFTNAITAAMSGAGNPGVAERKAVQKARPGTTGYAERVKKASINESNNRKATINVSNN